MVKTNLYSNFFIFQNGYLRNLKTIDRYMNDLNDLMNNIIAKALQEQDKTKIVLLICLKN